MFNSLRRFFSVLRTSFNLLRTLVKLVQIKDDCISLSYGEAQISLTQEGDILIKAKRNLIQDYEYSFSKCDPSFIDSFNQREALGMPLAELSSLANLKEISSFQELKLKDQAQEKAQEHVLSH